MSDFARQQAEFQRGILSDDDTVLAEILDSPREKRDALFGVYRYAYGSRLVEAVRIATRDSELPAQGGQESSHRRAHHLRGEGGFGTLARVDTDLGSHHQVRRRIAVPQPRLSDRGTAHSPLPRPSRPGNLRRNDFSLQYLGSHGRPTG